MGKKPQLSLVKNTWLPLNIHQKVPQGHEHQGRVIKGTLT
jgi:hypothetical protein